MTTTREPTAKQLATAADRARQYTRRRDELVAAAVAAGMPLRTVAAHVGVSTQTVANIARRAADRAMEASA